MSPAAEGAGIVWLASYPKSGNTWLRIFLANYMRDADRPVSINALRDGGGFSRTIASARELLSETLGIDAAGFTHDEIDALRPEAYRVLAKQASERPYLKVHDANVTTTGGEYMFPPDVTLLAIYLVRNPLDVAVSFANHARQPIDRVIQNMADPDFAFASGRRGLRAQLRQRLLTWSQHVESWADAPAFPVHVVRYEDMLARPVDTFRAIAGRLGLPDDAARLERAVMFSRFDELRRQETESPEGFLEAPPGVDHFFHQGRAGGWRDHLTGAQAARVTEQHGLVMRRFGYLDTAGRPTV